MNFLIEKTKPVQVVLSVNVDVFDPLADVIIPSLGYSWNTYPNKDSYKLSHADSPIVMLFRFWGWHVEEAENQWTVDFKGIWGDVTYPQDDFELFKAIVPFVAGYGSITFTDELYQPTALSRYWRWEFYDESLSIYECKQITHYADGERLWTNAPEEELTQDLLDDLESEIVTPEDVDEVIEETVAPVKRKPGRPKKVQPTDE